jgi:hypothetical protein
VWDVPISRGLTPTIAHGGGQFSISAKSYLTGSLLADDVATRLNHPELACWVLDWPNPDDRPFRATRERFAAFRNVLAHYWEGRFHPAATGVRTAGHAIYETGFEPALDASPKSMDPAQGPIGTPQQVFQTNFVFGRAARLRAQAVHPGYWQSAHPVEEGYRPDQIMRYGEGNLNRLRIRGELHVKRDDPMEVARTPDYDAPLDASMLVTEASWEDRAQMSRTSARDMVEAILLDVHHAQWLQKHPCVAVIPSLQQDMLLQDAEATLERRGKSGVLARLRREARTANLEASRGRVRSDWVEPETLFWAAWKALQPGERAAVAHEAVKGFVERVHQAAEVDPRPDRGDPMEPHRHRVHPMLWAALEAEPTVAVHGDPVRRELDAWNANRSLYLSRRPAFSYGEPWAPWDA